MSALTINANPKNIVVQETFKVTQVSPEHGSYVVTPEVPADGMVPSGTELTVTATAAKGYSLDAVYYTFKGGLWGTLSIESFEPTIKITVDRDLTLGAVFVENSLVENLNIIHNVVYAQPGKKPLKYDVFSPKGAKNLPMAIIVHGGGWSSNNEDIMRGLARELAKDNRYVVFSIDYRWINQLDGDEEPNSMHELIEDVFGAIAHIQEHASKYGGDPDRIAVTGDSAGGHLSASAAILSSLIGDGGFGETEGVYEFNPTYIPKGKTVEEVRSHIMEAVKVAAPSYGLYSARDFKQFIGEAEPEYLDAVSPVSHVPNIAERAVPHFMVRGTEDGLVTQSVVQPYVQKLNEQGQTVKNIEVEGAGHAFFDWKPDARTRATFKKFGVPYAAQMKSFFDTVFYK
ncbi:MAG: alpha/beta hydrolase [Algicola sp.]|nr:alpha/beta hydrolase [Algicola sp.]